MSRLGTKHSAITRGRRPRANCLLTPSTHVDDHKTNPIP
jgi:hypothetical protein